QVGGELVDAAVPGVRLDTALRYQEVLRRGAHLPAVQRQRERQIAQHPAVVVGGVDDHRVEPGLLGVDDGLPGVRLQPVAELAGAGEVHDPDVRMGGQRDRDAVTRLGSCPDSASTSRATCTVMASGSTAPGCGLTITVLPATRLANSPGYP